MNLEEFLNKLNAAPEAIQFSETMAVIDSLYQFTPTAFRNGNLENAAGENNGSCKLLHFAQLQGLSPAQTLACFGEHYWQDVLPNPDGEGHLNIRNFMLSGWEGVAFKGRPLTLK